MHALFKISVIIPAHNLDNFLEKCIDSVVHNSFQDFEIVLVENGSSDKTLYVAKECLSKSLPEERYKVISIPEANVSKARNIGIEASNGKYLFFLDSDDYISPETLDVLYQAAEEANADVAYCPFDRIIQNGKNYKKLSYEMLYSIDEETTNGVKLLGDFLKGHKWLCTGNNIIRSKLIKKHRIRFPEEFYGGEDQCFYMKVLIYAQLATFTRRGRMFYIQHGQGSLASSTKVLDSLKVYDIFAQEIENGLYPLKMNDKEKLVQLIRKFKMPYLYVRAFYRLSKTLAYEDFLASLNQFKDMPAPLRVKSKLWFPTLIGYLTLKYFPRFFYKLSKHF